MWFNRFKISKLKESLLYLNVFLFFPVFRLEIMEENYLSIFKIILIIYVF